MYILSSVCLRLGQFSQLSFIQYIGLYIFSLSVSVMMIARIRVLPSFYHHQIESIRCMSFYILTASLGQWFKCSSRKQIVFNREAYNWPFYWPVWGLLYINENVQFVGPSVLCPIVKQLLNNSVDRLNCNNLWCSLIILSSVLVYKGFKRTIKCICLRKLFRLNHRQTKSCTSYFLLSRPLGHNIAPVYTLGWNVYVTTYYIQDTVKTHWSLGDTRGC